MEQATGPGSPEFLSTHPSHATRRADIRTWLPEANRYYAERPREGAVVVAAIAAPPGLPPPPPPPPPQAPQEPAEAAMPTSATTSLEEQFHALEALLARGTITDTEHGLLRKRLIETWSFRNDAAATQRPAPAASRPWVLGRWEGSHQGEAIGMDGTSFLFTLERGQIYWLMRRRTTIRNWTGNLQASGTVVAMTPETLELRGQYDGFSEGRTGGKPIEYSLKREGDQLDGVALGAEGLPFTVSVRRR
jgi:hypothetical protein